MGQGENTCPISTCGDFLIAGILTAIFECALPIMIAENKNLLCGMQVVIPGLLFFSLNKILLSYLNGISEMKVYAIFQSLRYILIAILILIMALMHVEGKYLSAALSMAEVILLVCMCLYLWRKKMLGGRVDRSWMHEHFRFGIRILPANMVLELNTRVDILCLGLVMRNDYLIGIYSFAALFAEGFYQIYIVIRRSINPQITAAHVNKGLCNFIKEFINSSIGKYFRVLSFSALILLAAGYLGICMLIGRHEYLGGIKLLIIIALAIAFNGKQIIFGNIFSQTGIPMYESYINVLTVTSNIILNVILIMWWGAYGAAIATSISYCVYGYAIKHLAKKKLDVKL